MSEQIPGTIILKHVFFCKFTHDPMQRIVANWSTWAQKCLSIHKKRQVDKKFLLTTACLRMSHDK